MSLPLSAGEVAAARSGLLAAFSNSLEPDKWVSALEISIYTSMPVALLQNLGFIAPISHGRGLVYVPAGALREELNT